MVGDISRKAAVLIFVAIFMVSGIQLAQAPQRQILDSTHQPESQKTLSQYFAHVPIYIYDISDFAALGFSGNGSSSNPFIIEWLNISARGSFGIYVYNTTAHFIIRNCFISSGLTGVYLDNVSNAVIEDCIFTSLNEGVAFVDSDFCIVRNSSVSETFTGIYFDASRNCTAIGSTINQNNNGIMLDAAENSTVIDNTVYGNRQKGIILNQQASSNIVFNNIVGWNGRDIDGLYPVTNAEDDGNNNQWDSEGVGNQWSDYLDEGPYEIQGSANVNDNFPLLLNDSQAPIVEGIDDVSMDVDDEGFTIRWNATDTYPLLYRIYRDGSLISTEEWFGGALEIEFFDFTVGFYNYTVQFEDCAGNLSNDTVVILVYMNMFGGSSTYLILYGSLASILAVVIVVLILKKIR